MATKIVEPRYKDIVTLNYLSSTYEYPKSKELFIWGVPNEYKERFNMEISAITACFIYDGTDKSIKAAKTVEEWFNQEPYQFIVEKRYNDIIMTKPQDECVYQHLTVKDMFLFFCKLNELYTEYDGILGKYRVTANKGYSPTMKEVLSPFRGFNGASVVSYARVNMFLFMMVHCFEVYQFDQSQLIAPIFPKQLASFKKLGLTKKARLTPQVMSEVSQNLKWYTAKYPMTFVVGVYAYILLQKENPKLLNRISNMELVRKKFNKR